MCGGEANMYISEPQSSRELGCIWKWPLQTLSACEAWWKGQQGAFQDQTNPNISGWIVSKVGRDVLARLVIREGKPCVCTSRRFSRICSGGARGKGAPNGRASALPGSLKHMGRFEQMERDSEMEELQSNCVSKEAYTSVKRGLY